MHSFSINGQSTENRRRSQRTATPCKIKENNSIDRIGVNNRVNTSNFNPTILKFSKKYDHQFSNVSIYRNMFSVSHDLVAMPVTSCIKDTRSN